jgi:molybdopterin synthase sulfur carrier subunit
MSVEVLFFGSMKDATDQSSLSLEDMVDTDRLKLLLEEKYPSLKTAKYFIAVNQQMIQGNQHLHPGDIVALMPPFSGG